MPRRKPASARANRETRDIGLARLARSGVPECPKPNGKPMLAVTRAAWATFWGSDVAGLVLDADRPALDRLFSLYDLRERMLRAYLKTPFSTGSLKQVTIHPAAKELASLDGRIVALEHDFGITPAGRLKLGIVLGAAAKSLEAMNDAFNDDSDEDSGEELDPRKVTYIDATARG